MGARWFGNAFIVSILGLTMREQSQVRNIGVIEGNQPVSDNDWEAIKRGGDAAIEKWIASQMSGRTCNVVLAGSATGNRKWINYEISKSWNDGMGVVGVYIHGLKNFQSETSTKGANPLDYVTFKNTGNRLSSIAKCYDPIGVTSKEKYDWISSNLSRLVEEAIKIRNT